MKQIYIFYFILAAGHCFNQQASGAEQPCSVARRLLQD